LTFISVSDNSGISTYFNITLYSFVSIISTYLLLTLKLLKYMLGII